jgi:hypothetical protein
VNSLRCDGPSRLFGGSDSLKQNISFAFLKEVSALYALKDASSLCPFCLLIVDFMSYAEDYFLPIESLAHDSGRTLVCAEYGYPKGSPNTNS